MSAPLPGDSAVTRRSVLVASAVALLCACTGPAGPGAPPARRDDDPLRLTARPDPDAARTLPAGTSKIPLSNGRTALVHVPPRPVPALVVSLHGAGGDAASGLRLLREEADRRGFVVLAPASAGATWAAISGGDDRDTRALQAALDDVLARSPVAPAHLAVAGFSDGASYALTLGLANGDVFPRVVAFSPGFEAAGERRGRPSFLVTHGTRDDVLPIARTSRVLVPALREQGYDVTYREFDGPHVVPPELAAEAAGWVLSGATSAR